MVTSIFTSIFAYISTNIDDIFVLMILLSQVQTVAKGKLIAGHFIGVGLLTLISIVGAMGLQRLPTQYIGLLGIIPIFLGIRACFQRDGDEHTAAVTPGVLSMALITLGNGADNLGVYIPLFTGFTSLQQWFAAGIFALMTALWVWLAHCLAALPKVKAVIGKYKAVLIPLVFIALGIFIILDSGLLG